MQKPNNFVTLQHGFSLTASADFGNLKPMTALADVERDLAEMEARHAGASATSPQTINDLAESVWAGRRAK